MKYRKKPTIIEAQQWDGTFIEMERIENEMGIGIASKSYNETNNTVLYWNIPTLEGTHKVSKNDWLIKGVKGEIYPCKPYIFEKTYEKV